VRCIWRTTFLLQGMEYPLFKRGKEEFLSCLSTSKGEGSPEKGKIIYRAALGEENGLHRRGRKKNLLSTREEKKKERAPEKWGTRISREKKVRRPNPFLQDVIKKEKGGRNTGPLLSARGNEDPPRRGKGGRRGASSAYYF